MAKFGLGDKPHFQKFGDWDKVRQLVSQFPAEAEEVLNRPGYEALFAVLAVYAGEKLLSVVIVPRLPHRFSSKPRSISQTLLQSSRTLTRKWLISAKHSKLRVKNSTGMSGRRNHLNQPLSNSLEIFQCL